MKKRGDRRRDLKRKILKFGSVMLTLLLAFPADFLPAAAAAGGSDGSIFSSAETASLQESMTPVEDGQPAAYWAAEEDLLAEEELYSQGETGEAQGEESDFAWMDGFTEAQLKSVPLEMVAESSGFPGREGDLFSDSSEVAEEESLIGFLNAARDEALQEETADTESFGMEELGEMGEEAELFRSGAGDSPDGISDVERPGSQEVEDVQSFFEESDVQEPGTEMTFRASVPDAASEPAGTAEEVTGTLDASAFTPDISAFTSEDGESEAFENVLINNEEASSSEEVLDSEEEVFDIEEDVFGSEEKVLDSEEEIFSSAETPESGEAPEEPQVPELDLADVSEVTLKVEDGEDLTLALNILLLKVSDYAVDEKPYRVIIPPGSYSLTGTINTYSNIHLYAVGARITKRSQKKQILLRLGKSEVSEGGYNGYRNVTIEGGIWDCNYECCLDKEKDGGFVGFRIGHATNVLIKNVTFLNTLKSHLLELGGVKKARVTGCKFSGYWKPCEDRGQECIQIDVCQDDYFPRYQPFDGTACRDIVIENNEFTDVFSGLGSHNMMFDNPYRNITIQNNRFTNVKYRGIMCLNFRDSVIKNNVFKNVGGSIYILSMSDSNARLLPGQSGAITGNQDPENLVISNNTISMAQTMTLNGALRKTFGIFLSGKRNASSGSGIAKGLYPLRGVTVKGNTISGPGRAVYLLLADDCVVYKNKLTMKQANKYCNDGILLQAGRNNIISQNEIKNTPGYGVYITKGSSVYHTCSTGNRVSGNTITGSGLGDIKADENSDNLNISNNTLKNGKKRGIIVRKCVVTKMTGNHISGMGVTGIYLVNSTIKNIKQNVVEGLKGYHAIYMSGCKGQTVVLKRITCGKITPSVRKITGTAVGGKKIVITKKYGGAKVGSASVDKKNKYTVKVSKQAKGRQLLLTVTDKYGNKIIQSTKVV